MASLSDERRVVTVLFADVVGYTAMAEPLDPELVKNLIDDLFQRLVADITEFGGQVDKIVGDAIVALFGAPTAHEDDAERAVRSALRMQQTLGALADVGGDSAQSAMRMRIGVNTGEVLVGALRAGGSITAMGDVVNTASRLQTCARPGEVIVGPATHHATRDVIRYEPRGLVAAKGRDEKIQAWSAVEALLPPGYRPRRRTSPLVGRDAEVGLLRQTIDSGVGNGRALLALVVGDAGVGKSRLAEVASDWAVSEHGAICFEGRCVPYGEANVWWPIAEALRHACLVEVSTEANEARIRTIDRVAQALDLAPSSPNAERVANGLLFLMGRVTALDEIDPANAREEAVRSVVSFFEGVTNHQPVVIRLSDLHWADGVVLELIETVLARLARRPFVLLATARQAIRETWNPRPGRHNIVNLNLDPLGPAAAGDLLDQLVGPLDSPELRRTLIERSGGNPFFLEELLTLVGARPSSVVDGVQSVDSRDLNQLPDTLRGLVAARLDGLGPDERAVLTDGAVLGRRGRVEHLRRLAEGVGRAVDVDDVVASLVEKEMFELVDGGWEFRSELVREVAYNTITKLDRARRHVGIASWTEANHLGEWSDGAVERLAHHYGVGAELILDLGGEEDGAERIRDRALHWIGEAAERAREHDLLDVASRLYSQGLTLAGPGPDVRRVVMLLGRSQVRTNAWDLEGARADAEAAMADAAALGDETCGARSLLVLGDVARKGGDTEKAVAILHDAAERFAGLGDDQGRGEALRLEGMAELFRGAVDAAEDIVRAALVAFHSAGSRRGEAWALQNLAWIAFTTGRIDEADERLERSLATFTELGDGIGRSWAMGLQAFVRFHQGRHDEAETLGLSILEDARDRNDRWPTAMMLVLMSLIRLWSGRTESAVEDLTEAQSIFSSIGDAYGRTMALGPLARALLMVGRVQEGMVRLDEAAAIAGDMPGDEALQMAQLTMAGAHVQLGEPGRALAGGVLGEADSIPSDMQAGQEAAVTKVFALMQAGRLIDAVAVVEAIVARPESGHGADRPLTRSAMALVAAAHGRVAEAVEHAEAVPRHPAATYLDVAMASLAAGLAFAGSGDESAAQDWLDAAVGLVDATEDRLGQAIVRLAKSVALEVLDSSAAAAAATDAELRLAGLGIEAGGWRQAFVLAARKGITVAP